MINQLKVEFFKARRFWLTYIAAAIIGVAGFLYGFIKIPESLTSNDVFAAAVCDTSFIFIITLVCAWFVGNDFYNRTVHNEIKIGHTRASVIASRSIVTFIMAMILHIVYVFGTVLGHSVKWGFDGTFFTASNFIWLLIILVQMCANISLIMLIVFTLKKVLPAISGAIIFSVVSCNVLRNYISDSAFGITCFSLAQTNDSETLIPSLIFAAVTIAVSLTAAFAVFRKAEIK